MEKPRPPMGKLGEQLKKNSKMLHMLTVQLLTICILHETQTLWDKLSSHLFYALKVSVDPLAGALLKF